MIKHQPPDTTAPDRPAKRVPAQIISFDLESELKTFRESAAYRRNDHASTTLVNRPGLGAVLAALPRGGHLKEHRAARPVTVNVIEGRVRLYLGDRTEDSAFLITIGGSPVEPRAGR